MVVTRSVLIGLGVFMGGVWLWVVWVGGWERFGWVLFFLDFDGWFCVGWMTYTRHIKPSRMAVKWNNTI
jgi:hypothetical protein